MADLALDLENLVAGLDERFFQAINLLRHLGFGQMAFGDVGAGSAEDQDFATTNSSRDRNAPEGLFSLIQRLCHGYSLN